MNTQVIAEAGINHNGEVETAFELVRAASAAGADFVKFQTFKAKSMSTSDAKKATYQMSGKNDNESQLEMLSKLELSEEEHIAIMDVCQDEGIRFLSSAFDLESFALLEKLGCTDIIKIPSGEITNYPFLRHVGRTQGKIILSTGMCTMDEIEDALLLLEKEGTTRSNVTVLQCTTEYPARFVDVNLRTLKTFSEAFEVAVGYSDHTTGIAAPLAAVALGASVIEKHFTLDRNQEGPDHAASLEPSELAEMVQGIRHIEMALGDGKKTLSKGEIKNRVIARKSIVAKQPIAKGEVFSENNLTTKRPGNGISPMLWPELIGTKATQDYQQDEQISK